MNNIQFLNLLKENNNKDWMTENKALFHATRDAFWKEAQQLLDFLKSREPRMNNLELKDCVFRQNRDIRFSKNKSPYKINLSAYFSIGGKKSNSPGYYIHIEPNESFLGAGVWMPDKTTLDKIREEIDYSGDELIKLIKKPLFHENFPKIIGDKLKRAPKNYEIDHPNIELLKYKSFVVQFPLSNEEVINDTYLDTAKEKFSLAQEFVNYFQKAVDFEP